MSELPIGSVPSAEDAPCPVATTSTASVAGALTQERQVDAVFDTIAIQANLLREFLRDLRRQPQRHGDPATLFADLAMAEVLANQIGALADQMVDGRVVGSLAAWAVGPDFS